MAARLPSDRLPPRRPAGESGVAGAVPSGLGRGTCAAWEWSQLPCSAAAGPPSPGAHSGRRLPRQPAAAGRGGSAPPSQTSRAAAGGAGRGVGEGTGEDGEAPAGWAGTLHAAMSAGPARGARHAQTPHGRRPVPARACPPPRLCDRVAGQRRHVAAAQDGIIHAACARQPLGRHRLAGAGRACKMAQDWRHRVVGHGFYDGTARRRQHCMMGMHHGCPPHTAPPAHHRRACGGRARRAASRWRSAPPASARGPAARCRGGNKSGHVGARLLLCGAHSRRAAAACMLQVAAPAAA